MPCEFSAVTCNGASAATVPSPTWTKPSDVMRTLSVNEFPELVCNSILPGPLLPL